MSRTDDFAKAGQALAETKRTSEAQAQCRYDFDIAAEYGYQYAQEHPAWVSVEEKMPEENTAPLVRMDLTEKFGEETILYDVVAFDGNGFHTPYKVTHWMQITPPVKKGGNNEND